MPKSTLNFALRMARSVKQHCADPMYRFDSFLPDMVSCLLDCLRYSKSFFLQIMKHFLLNKSRRAQVCRTLLMHWFVHFISKRSSSRRAHSRKFFACSDPQPSI